MTDIQSALSRRQALQALAALGVASPLWTQAQSTWPTKPVTLVVPFPAGGGTDAFARPLSAQFARLTGKQLIVDNRGGAGGTLGATIAAKAVPDGYTLFMGSSASLAVNPLLYNQLPYDPKADFAGISMLAASPLILVVPQDLPVSIEIVNLERSQPIGDKAWAALCLNATRKALGDA